MKKNGRRHRRLQREKELQKIRTDQEADIINTSNLAMAHIIKSNPIVRDSDEVKAEYLKRLKGYLRRAGWDRRKLVKAGLEAYEKIVMEENSLKERHDITFYRYYVLFDLMQAMAYDFKPSDGGKLRKVKDRYKADSWGPVDGRLVDDIFKIAASPERKAKALLKEEGLAAEREYIELVYRNIRFKNREPFRVMVTATMSAGKSTFINALTGKYICLSQNMACTSKIHCIVNKAFEDGFSSEYDHELVLTAGREELLNDNELNSSDKIIVSTRFTGGLSDRRIIVNDSPGVNYSGNAEHKKVAQRLLKARKYDLLIYVMNATQLGTNDESVHLDFVRETVGRTPVLFVMNKIDAFDTEEEDVSDAIRRQAGMLGEKGFRNPVICPVSARAGYLAKQFQEGGLSRSGERELYAYVDKFNQMKLCGYYAGTFQDIRVEDSEKEEIQLLKTCGLAYIEKIIAAMCEGGKRNGAGIR